MTAGAPTIGGLKRLSRYLAGQLASAVVITGGTITGAVVTANLRDSTVEAGSTAAAFANNGVTEFGSTLGTTTYTIAAPVAGIYKFLNHAIGSSLAEQVYSGSSLIKIGENSSVNRINFTAAGQTAPLKGISATKWIFLGANSTLVTLSS